MVDKPNPNPNPEPYLHGYEKDKTFCLLYTWMNAFYIYIWAYLTCLACKSPGIYPVDCFQQGTRTNNRFGAKPPAPQYYKVATIRDNIWKLALSGHLNTDVRARFRTHNRWIDHSATDPRK